MGTRLPPELVAPRPLYHGRVNGGHVSAIDPADIPDEALSRAMNVRINRDKTSRRPGNVIFSPTKPNSYPVVGFGLYKKGTAIYLLRFATDDVNYSVHYENAGAWTALTGTVAATSSDRVRVIIVNDIIVVAFDGATRLKKIDVVANTIADLAADAPYLRYITGFNDRILGAYEVDADDPIGVYWSGARNFSVFNPATDDTAGNTPLVDSPSDFTDLITGVFAYTSEAVILRERSIWLAQKQPSPQNPFYFFSAVPEIGCNSPDTAVLTDKGVVFADTRTGAVYVYVPKGGIEQIDGLVEPEIFSGIDDPTKMTGDYNIRNGQHEYTITAPIQGSDVKKVWTYNFDTKAWVYDEMENIQNLIQSFEYAAANAMIEDLPGTIEQLSGNIELLGTGSAIVLQSRFIGKPDGDILREEATAVNDGSAEFESVIETKEYQQPTEDTYFAGIRARLEVKVAGSFDISYSKDGNTWILTKIIAVSTGKKIFIQVKRNIKAKQLRWRLATKTAIFDLLELTVLVSPGAESKP